MKRLDAAVFATIQDTLQGIFASGTMTYSLAANGVGLAPFHQAEPNIPSGVRVYLDELRKALAAGRIDVLGPCTPFQVYLPVVIDP